MKVDDAVRSLSSPVFLNLTGTTQARSALEAIGNLNILEICGYQIAVVTVACENVYVSDLEQVANHDLRSAVPRAETQRGDAILDEQQARPDAAVLRGISRIRGQGSTVLQQVHCNHPGVVSGPCQ